MHAQVTQAKTRLQRLLHFARQRFARVVIEQRARTVGGERIHAIGERVEVDAHERVRILPSRLHPAFGEPHRGKTRAGHHHVRAARTQQLRELEPHGEHGITFVEPGGAGGAGGRMPGVHRDRESLERLRRVDARHATHPQHERAACLVPD